MSSVDTEQVALHDAARLRYGLPHPLALAVLVIMMFGVTFATSAGAAAAEPGPQPARRTLSRRGRRVPDVRGDARRLRSRYEARPNDDTQAGRTAMNCELEKTA